MDVCNYLAMNIEKKMSKIHLNLDSVSIIKTDLDKIIFGLFKHATDKDLNNPFIFTANISVKDNSYLGVLKNNGVCLLDECPDEKDVDILFSDKYMKSSQYLLSIPNITIFGTTTNPRSCVYMDWDNIQVSPEYINSLIGGIDNFIHGIKKHSVYQHYVFLHDRVSVVVRKMLKKLGVNIINIIKDKPNSGDGEMFRYIRQNTIPGDSLCIASGDRDFSPIMIEYVRGNHDVFLVYNKQALYTFKHNRHWIGSVDIRSLDGVDIKNCNVERVDQTKKRQKNTKPCKYYNLDVCTSNSCSFLHICGICGRSHKTRDFHPGVTTMKGIICKKYNIGMCNYSDSACDYLHICLKCKNSHKYIDCMYIIMYCPLCRITMKSNTAYVMHQIEPFHVGIVDVFKRILCEYGTNNKYSVGVGHILITS
jgi:hypothetical protein